MFILSKVNAALDSWLLHRRLVFRISARARETRVRAAKRRYEKVREGDEEDAVDAEIVEFISRTHLGFSLQIVTVKR